MPENNMIISACIPCMNRTYDLKRTLPSIIRAANASPPVEILVLNYNSQDDLEEYIDKVRTRRFTKGVTLCYYKYTKRNYYHLAHAYNLSIRLSAGEYFAVIGTDSILSADYFKAIRKKLEEDDYVWLYNKVYGGIIVCQKREFVEAGGYDERFEMYGPEDKELELRLHRRGGKMGILPPGLLEMIETSRKAKFANYDRARIGGRKKRMRAIYLENKENNVLVVNRGKDWGAWK